MSLSWTKLVLEDLLLTIIDFIDRESRLSLGVRQFSSHDLLSLPPVDSDQCHPAMGFFRRDLCS